MNLHSQGLKFNNNKQPIKERTSYNVFCQSKVSFYGDFEISFDLSFYDFEEIGNIIRIKNEKDEKVFSLFYDEDINNHYFLLNEEGKSNLLSFSFAKEDISLYQWLNVTLKSDLKNNCFNLSLNDQKKQSKEFIIENKFNPIIEFGKSDHIIDVPSIIIRNLHIKNGKKEYSFLFYENEGSDVHNSRGKKQGKVINPNWIINDFYYWKPVMHHSSATVSGTNYNEQTDEIYFFNQDSITIINLRDQSHSSFKYTNKCPVNMDLGTNFINYKNHKIYCYEVYSEHEKDQPSVASLNLKNLIWETESFKTLPMQLHHHGTFYDDKKQEQIIFGGFGNAQYSNVFYRYEVEEKKWEEIDIKNNILSYRYFSSLGYDNENEKVYIFGGMGNESGNQLYGREYYYDLHQLDINSGELSFKWKLAWDGINVVPTRNMLIDNQYFYVLCYPEYYTQSFLKLYKFSSKNGKYEILGDSIPIFSDKIKTNANLYYSNNLQKIYAVIHEYKDDNQSVLNIYEISFPPVNFTTLMRYSTQSSGTIKRYLTPLIIILFLITATLLLIIKNKRRNNNNLPAQDIPLENNFAIPDRKNNSIYLFGEFQVYSKNSKDITYLFSKKIKESFLLILHHSKLNDGISSSDYSKILWPERSYNDAKNIRNVSINRLRKVLEELDNVEINYEKGVYKTKFSNNMYCDFSRLYKIISTNLPINDYEEIIGILSRGKFLDNDDSEILDKFKADVEAIIEPLIMKEMQVSFFNKAYEKTIQLSEIIFQIDPINEVSLEYLISSYKKLNMIANAKSRYMAFAINYKRTTGKDYSGKIEI